MDADHYLLGEYVFEAVSAAIGNALKKKSAKPITFADMREKPILQMAEEDRKEQAGELSDAEKKRRAELLFTNLDIMAANFRMQKAQKEREGE